MALVKVPYYTYLFIKYRLSNCPYFRKVPLIPNYPLITNLISSILTLSVTPILFVTLGGFLGYKIVIDLVLRFKLGSRYHGQMPGVDALCANQDVCTPSFFLLVDCKCSLEDLRKKFIAFLHTTKSLDRNRKLFYSWSSYKGYHYYYKNELTIEDYIVIAKNDGVVIRNKSDFSKVIVQYDTAPMPDDNHALFHAIIYPQEVQLPGYEGTTLVCFKMHHALADGKAVLGWIMAELADKDIIQQANGQHKVTNNQNIKPKEESYLAQMKKALVDDKLKLLPTDIYDENILSGKALKEEKFICWFSDPTTECVDKIRAIRKSRVGVTFLDVINTCISSSLQEYFEKYSKEIPEKIFGGVVLSPAKYSFQYGDANYKFSNEFSMGGFHFPISINPSCNDRQEELLAKLNFCQKEYQATKESVDVQFNYWLADIFAMMPHQIPQYMAKKMTSITIGVSSLPGTDKLVKIFGGYEVKDVVLMPPNSTGTALHFVICTYGKNNLRIGLTIDKSVVSEFADAQNIVDGIVKYLDLLYKSLVDT